MTDERIVIESDFELESEWMSFVAFPIDPLGKSQPSPSDVHVDRPLGGERRRKRRRKENGVAYDKAEFGETP